MSCWTRYATIACSTLLLLCTACGDDDPAPEPQQRERERIEVPEQGDVYSFVDGCYALHATPPDSAEGSFLAPADGGDSFAFGASEAGSAAAFYMQPSGLGTYVLYDDEEQYLVAGDDGFDRKAELRTSLMEMDDDYSPGAQWRLEVSPVDDERFRLQHLATERYLTTEGLTDDEGRAAVVSLLPAQGCAEYPELTLDAEGTPRSRKWDDGSVWGFVETHTHIMTNFSFGGGGIFHGAPFHPLGVEYALPSCKPFHGEQGRQDLFGYAFYRQNGLDTTTMIDALNRGRTPEPDHETAGYPEFTDWPDAPDTPTHQTQYYKWIERAYLSGMRLMVQHTTSNEIICQLLTGSDIQETRYSCNDMRATDRILKETRRLERYIDAQNGGPGEGWFRIVETPGEAREVINDGKMAVILGIEVSNLFDCYLVPPEGKERCTKEDVVEALDEYEQRGVRAIFPVHKFDNGFSAGDGHRGIIELGNFAQTGHESNFVEDCPGVPAGFDQGDVQFGGLNDPRDDYFAEPPVDMSNFENEPVKKLLEHSDKLTDGSLEGDYCQNHGLTDLGRFLVRELMRRGMIIEVDHLPQRSLQQTFDMLEANDYPAVGSHGGNFDGKVYEVGGVSKFNFDVCADPDDPGSRADGLNQRLNLMQDAGAYPAEGFGFDLNGFAGAPGPRFGEESNCEKPQENPVEYPFESYGGNVTFTQPQLGEREPDFNTEGMVHIGMIPELLEDVQNTGVTRDELEPLFRSAEGYLRMWEKARQRAEELSE